MAKAIVLVVSGLCVLALAAFTPAYASKPAHTNIVGKVYCDTCRVQFLTELSKNIGGAEVSLICRNPITQETKYEKTTHTNPSGLYTIRVEGDHTDEICEVKVVKSPDENCNEEMDDTLNKVQVDLALNEGIHQKVRYVNPLGFIAKEALPGCKKVLDDMGFVPIAN